MFLRSLRNLLNTLLNGHALVKSACFWLCVLYFFTNVAFAHKPEANFWQERRQAVSRHSEDDDLKLASLPVPILPRPESLSVFPPHPNPLPRWGEGNYVGTLPQNQGSHSFPQWGPGGIAESIPWAYATLKEVSLQTAGKLSTADCRLPTVVLIQDVHGNPEAQTNIAKILESLAHLSPPPSVGEDQGGGNGGRLQTKQLAPPSSPSPTEGGRNLVIGLEGAQGILDFSALRSLPDPQITEEVSRYLLSKGEIGGPVYAGLTSQRLPAQFWGLEEPELYRKNVQAYRESLPLKDKVTSQLKSIETDLQNTKAQVYNEELKKLDEARTRYLAGSMPLGEYLACLAPSSSPPPSVGRRNLNNPSPYEGEGGGEGKNIGRFFEAYRIEQSLNFQEVEKERSEILKVLVSKLDKKKLSELLGESLAYRMGKIGYAGYYGYLRDLCRKNGVNLGQPTLTRPLATLSLKGEGRLERNIYPAMAAYIHYVLLVDQINLDKLQEEVSRAEEESFEALAVTSEQKELWKLSKALSLTQALVRFEMTPTQWGEYEELRGEGKGEGKGFLTGRLVGPEEGQLSELSWNGDHGDPGLLSTQPRRRRSQGMLLASQSLASSFSGWIQREITIPTSRIAPINNLMFILNCTKNWLANPTAKIAFMKSTTVSASNSLRFVPKRNIDTAPLRGASDLRHSFSLSLTAENINAETGNIQLSLTYLHAFLSPFESFYQNADARNRAMVKNLVGRLQSTVSSRQTTVGSLCQLPSAYCLLVVGGYHTPGITQLLREKGVSYVVLAPKITKIEGDPSAYLTVFAREKTPLEKLFEGERLFINPEVWVPGSHPRIMDFGQTTRFAELGIDFYIPGMAKLKKFGRILSLTRWFDEAMRAKLLGGIKNPITLTNDPQGDINFLTRDGESILEVSNPGTISGKKGELLKSYRLPSGMEIQLRVIRPWSYYLRGWSGKGRSLLRGGVRRDANKLVGLKEGEKNTNLSSPENKHPAKKVGSNPLDLGVQLGQAPFESLAGYFQDYLLRPVFHFIYYFYQGIRSFIRQLVTQYLWNSNHSHNPSFWSLTNVNRILEGIANSLPRIARNIQTSLASLLSRPIAKFAVVILVALLVPAFLQSAGEMWESVGQVLPQPQRSEQWLWGLLGVGGAIAAYYLTPAMAKPRKGKERGEQPEQNIFDEIESICKQIPYKALKQGVVELFDLPTEDPSDPDRPGSVLRNGHFMHHSKFGLMATLGVGKFVVLNLGQNGKGAIYADKHYTSTIIRIKASGPRGQTYIMHGHIYSHSDIDEPGGKAPWDQLIGILRYLRDESFSDIEMSIEVPKEESRLPFLPKDLKREVKRAAAASFNLGFKRLIVHHHRGDDQIDSVITENLDIFKEVKANRYTIRRWSDTSGHSPTGTVAFLWMRLRSEALFRRLFSKAIDEHPEGRVPMEGVVVNRYVINPDVDAGPLKNPTDKVRFSQDPELGWLVWVPVDNVVVVEAPKGAKIAPASQGYMSCLCVSFRGRRTEAGKETVLEGLAHIFPKDLFMLDHVLNLLKDLSQRYPRMEINLDCAPGQKGDAPIQRFLEALKTSQALVGRGVTSRRHREASAVVVTQDKNLLWHYDDPYYNHDRTVRRHEAMAWNNDGEFSAGEPTHLPQKRPPAASPGTVAILWYPLTWLLSLFMGRKAAAQVVSLIAPFGEGYGVYWLGRQFGWPLWLVAALAVGISLIHLFLGVYGRNGEILTVFNRKGHDSTGPPQNFWKLWLTASLIASTSLAAFLPAIFPVFFQQFGFFGSPLFLAIGPHLLGNLAIISRTTQIKVRTSELFHEISKIMRNSFSRPRVKFAVVILVALLVPTFLQAAGVGIPTFAENGSRTQALLLMAFLLVGVVGMLVGMLILRLLDYRRAFLDRQARQDLRDEEIGSVKIPERFKKALEELENENFIGKPETLRVYKDFMDEQDRYFQRQRRDYDGKESFMLDHIRWVIFFTVLMVKRLRTLRPDLITDKHVLAMFLAAAGHDKGKMGIEPGILYKKGLLNNEERAVMKKHVTAPIEELRTLFEALKGEGVDPMIPLAVTLLHHKNFKEQEPDEKNDYPDGTRRKILEDHGIEITDEKSWEILNILVDIARVADIFSAKIGVRDYEGAISFEEALAILEDEAAKGIVDPLAVSLLRDVIPLPFGDRMFGSLRRRLGSIFLVVFAVPVLELWGLPGFSALALYFNTQPLIVPLFTSLFFSLIYVALQSLLSVGRTMARSPPSQRLLNLKPTPWKEKIHDFFPTLGKFVFVSYVFSLPVLFLQPLLSSFFVPDADTWAILLGSTLFASLHSYNEIELQKSWRSFGVSLKDPRETVYQFFYRFLARTLGTFLISWVALKEPVFQLIIPTFSEWPLIGVIFTGCLGHIFWNGALTLAAEILFRMNRWPNLQNLLRGARLSLGWKSEAPFRRFVSKAIRILKDKEANDRQIEEVLQNIRDSLRKDPFNLIDKKETEELVHLVMAHLDSSELLREEAILTFIALLDNEQTLTFVQGKGVIEYMVPLMDGGAIQNEVMGPFHAPTRFHEQSGRRLAVIETLLDRWQDLLQKESREELDRDRAYLSDGIPPQAFPHNLQLWDAVVAFAGTLDNRLEPAFQGLAMNLVNLRLISMSKGNAQLARERVLSDIRWINHLLAGGDLSLYQLQLTELEGETGLVKVFIGGQPKNPATSPGTVALAWNWLRKLGVPLWAIPLIAAVGEGLGVGLLTQLNTAPVAAFGIATALIWGGHLFLGVYGRNGEILTVFNRKGHDSTGPPQNFWKLWFIASTIASTSLLAFVPALTPESFQWFLSLFPSGWQGILGSPLFWAVVPHFFFNVRSAVKEKGIAVQDKRRVVPGPALPEPGSAPGTAPGIASHQNTLNEIRARLGSGGGALVEDLTFLLFLLKNETDRPLWPDAANILGIIVKKPDAKTIAQTSHIVPALQALDSLQKFNLSNEEEVKLRLGPESLLLFLSDNPKETLVGLQTNDVDAIVSRLLSTDEKMRWITSALFRSVTEISENHKLITQKHVLELFLMFLWLYDHQEDRLDNDAYAQENVLEALERLNELPFPPQRSLEILSALLDFYQDILDLDEALDPIKNKNFFELVKKWELAHLKALFEGRADPVPVANLQRFILINERLIPAILSFAGKADLRLAGGKNHATRNLMEELLDALFRVQVAFQVGRSYTSQGKEGVVGAFAEELTAFRRKLGAPDGIIERINVVLSQAQPSWKIVSENHRYVLRKYLPPDPPAMLVFDDKPSPAAGTSLSLPVWRWLFGSVARRGWFVILLVPFVLEIGFLPGLSLFITGKLSPLDGPMAAFVVPYIRISIISSLIFSALHGKQTAEQFGVRFGASYFMHLVAFYIPSLFAPVIPPIWSILLTGAALHAIWNAFCPPEYRLILAENGPQSAEAMWGENLGKVGRALGDGFMAAFILLLLAFGFPSNAFFRLWVPRPPVHTVVGGAKEVGPNSHLVEIGGKRVLVDMGMKLGDDNAEVLGRLRSVMQDGLDAVFITHDHLDHVGLLPFLYKFRREFIDAEIHGVNDDLEELTARLETTPGSKTLLRAVDLLSNELKKLQEERETIGIPIYATRETVAEMKITLRNGFSLMKMQQRQRGNDPLYSKKDLEDVLGSLVPIEMGKDYELGSQARFVAYNAAHILGAVSYEFTSLTGRVVITGDLGHEDHKPSLGRIERAPPYPALLVSEGTHGLRTRPNRNEEERKLIAAIREAIAHEGSVIIPVMALGRSQEVLAILEEAMAAGQLPSALDILFDGSISKINEVYKGKNFLPHDCPNIRKVEKEERTYLYRRLNGLGKPVVVVSTSGMLTGGLSIKYAKAALRNKRKTSKVILVSYQAPRTPGRQLSEATPGQTITWDDELFVIGEGQIQQINLTGHAGGDEIMKNINKLRPKRVALVHGERSKLEDLAEHAPRRFKPFVPDNGQSTVAAGHLGDSLREWFRFTFSRAETPPTLRKLPAVTAEKPQARPERPMPAQQPAARAIPLPRPVRTTPPARAAKPVAPDKIIGGPEWLKKKRDELKNLFVLNGMEEAEKADSIVRKVIMTAAKLNRTIKVEGRQWVLPETLLLARIMAQEHLDRRPVIRCLAALVMAASGNPATVLGDAIDLGKFLVKRGQGQNAAEVIQGVAEQSRTNPNAFKEKLKEFKTAAQTGEEAFKQALRNLTPETNSGASANSTEDPAARGGSAGLPILSLPRWRTHPVWGPHVDKWWFVTFVAPVLEWRELPGYAALKHARLASLSSISDRNLVLGTVALIILLALGNYQVVGLSCIAWFLLRAVWLGSREFALEHGKPVRGPPQEGQQSYGQYRVRFWAAFVINLAAFTVPLSPIIFLVPYHLNLTTLLIGLLLTVTYIPLIYGIAIFGHTLWNGSLTLATWVLKKLHLWPKVQGFLRKVRLMVMAPGEEGPSASRADDNLHNRIEELKAKKDEVIDVPDLHGSKAIRVTVIEHGEYLTVHPETGHPTSAILERTISIPEMPASGPGRLEIHLIGDKDDYAVDYKTGVRIHAEVDFGAQGIVKYIYIARGYYKILRKDAIIRLNVENARLNIWLGLIHFLLHTHEIRVDEDTSTPLPTFSEWMTKHQDAVVTFHRRMDEEYPHFAVPVSIETQILNPKDVKQTKKIMTSKPIDQNNEALKQEEERVLFRTLHAPNVTDTLRKEIWQFLWGKYEYIAELHSSKEKFQRLHDPLGEAYLALSDALRKFVFLEDSEFPKYAGASVFRRLIRKLNRLKSIDSFTTLPGGMDRLNEIPDQKPGPVREPDELSAKEQVEIILNTQGLKPEQKQLLELRYLKELSIKEMAEQLGTTPMGAKLRILRVIQKLRKTLRIPGSEPGDPGVSFWWLPFTILIPLIGTIIMVSIFVAVQLGSGLAITHSQPNLIFQDLTPFLLAMTLVPPFHGPEDQVNKETHKGGTGAPEKQAPSRWKSWLLALNPFPDVAMFVHLSSTFVFLGIAIFANLGPIARNLIIFMFFLKLIMSDLHRPSHKTKSFTKRATDSLEELDPDNSTDAETLIKWGDTFNQLAIEHRQISGKTIRVDNPSEIKKTLKVFLKQEKGLRPYVVRAWNKISKLKNIPPSILIFLIPLAGLLAAGWGQAEQLGSGLAITHSQPDLIFQDLTPFPLMAMVGVPGGWGLWDGVKKWWRKPGSLKPTGSLIHGSQDMFYQHYLNIKEKGLLPNAVTGRKTVAGYFPDKVSMGLSTDREFWTQALSFYGPVYGGNSVAFVIDPKYVKAHPNEFKLVGESFKGQLRDLFIGGLKKLGLQNNKYEKDVRAHPSEIQADKIPCEAILGVMVHRSKLGWIQYLENTAAEAGHPRWPIYLIDQNIHRAKKLRPYTLDTSVMKRLKWIGSGLRSLWNKICDRLFPIIVVAGAWLAGVAGTQGATLSATIPQSRSNNGEIPTEPGTPQKFGGSARKWLKPKAETIRFAQNDSLNLSHQVSGAEQETAQALNELVTARPTKEGLETFGSKSNGLVSHELTRTFNESREEERPFVFNFEASFVNREILTNIGYAWNLIQQSERTDALMIVSVHPEDVVKLGHLAEIHDKRLLIRLIKDDDTVVIDSGTRKGEKALSLTAPLAQALKEGRINKSVLARAYVRYIDYGIPSVTLQVPEADRNFLEPQDIKTLEQNSLILILLNIGAGAFKATDLEQMTNDQLRAALTNA